MIVKNPKTQVIFLGDLNYRIDMEKKEYQEMITNKNNSNVEMNYQNMVDRDQLRNQT